MKDKFAERKDEQNQNTGHLSRLRRGKADREDVDEKERPRHQRQPLHSIIFPRETSWLLDHENEAHVHC